MSAFLGPIHYLVYEKIIKLENFTDELLETYKIKLDLEAIKRGELSELIDLSNIHSSLSEMVELADRRNIKAISMALKSGAEEKDLEKAFEEFGLENNIGEKIQSLDLAFRFISNSSLDGMPCDFGLFICQKEETSLSFEINRKTHLDSLLDYGLEEETYFNLKRKFFQSLIIGSGLRITGQFNDFTLTYI